MFMSIQSSEAIFSMLWFFAISCFQVASQNNLEAVYYTVRLGLFEFILKYH